MKIVIVAVSLSALISAAATASQEQEVTGVKCEDAAFADDASPIAQPAGDTPPFTPAELSALSDLEEKCLRDEKNKPTCD